MSRPAVAETFLDSILRRKRLDVAERLGSIPRDVAPSRHSLRSALARPGARFILEVKKASPSGHRSGRSVDQAVAAYAPLADAVSVLTDGPAFAGSLDDLRAVRARFDGPILAKDFVVHPAQLFEARHHGADAVLAILAGLDDISAAEILATARSLNLDTLVEVHDEAELRRAERLGAEIIGINNRNLHSLEIDLSTTERLARKSRTKAILVSESGISSRSDVDRLSGLVDSFLVGSALMAADDIVQATRQLLFGPTKLCGLTRPDDVALAISAGATHAGLIFAPGSPRRIDADRAQALASTAASAGLRAVGVFQDQDEDEVARVADRLSLAAVQLHGREDYIHSLRRRLPGECEIWALCAVDDSADAPRAGADRTVFDTRSNGRSGGLGKMFDWAGIAARADLPAAFLAGGIGPRNARDARAVGAYGLDIGSAVESSPGMKDKALVDSLFASLRPADRRKTCA